MVCNLKKNITISNTWRRKISLYIRYVIGVRAPMLVSSDMCILVKQSTNSILKFEFYSRNIKGTHPRSMLLYIYKWAANFLIQYHSSSVIHQTTTMRVSFKSYHFSTCCSTKNQLSNFIFYLRHNFIYSQKLLSLL